MTENIKPHRLAFQ